MKIITMLLVLLFTMNVFARGSFSSSSRSSFSSSRSYSAPRSYTAPVSVTRKVIAPTASVTPVVSVRAVPVRRVIIAPRTVVVRRTVIVSRPGIVVVHTAPRYVYGGHYYAYPSLTAMALTAAMLSHTNQWQYYPMYITNGQPVHNGCYCNSWGNLRCGLFTSEVNIVCRQFRVGPDQQVEWR